MAYIVPESVLEHQVCSSCKNYLSFPPTKVYRNGEIKCGRCSVDNDEGTISIFDTLARSMLFPCVNRFDGCSELLHYTNVKEHEKNCVVLERECWKCPNYKGSLLNLVHHFKVMHPRDFLVTPELTCCMDKEFSRCFFYCDYARNVILILIVIWDLKDVYVKYKQLAKMIKEKPTLELLVTTDDDDDDDSKQCKDLNCTFVKRLKYQTIQTFKVPHYLNRIKYKWSLDKNDIMTTIRDYHSQSTQKYKRRSPYIISLDKEFMQNYHIMKTFVFEKYSLHIVCDFCGNLFASSGYVRDVYSDGSCYVCGTCFCRGVTKSLENNGNSLEKLKDYDFELLNFYCRFNCGKFFKSDDLLSHEDQCCENCEYMKLEYGDTCAEDKFSRGNVIFNLKRFKENGKIFVTTRDDFACVIDYDADAKLGVCHFHVKHGYDKKNYYISVHKWEDQTYSEVNNDFSMKIKNTNGPSLFALTVKEVQEDF